MNAGDKVRLKSDPSRVGTLTGEEQHRGGRRRLEVRFPDGEEFYLEGALELVPQDASVYSLFRDGRYGRLRDLRGAVTHSRLSGKLANLIYSMDTTNTEFYAYQFKPVLSFLESPNHGILIADEVGLGKTIEAGLIWTELRSRNDARRLLVICPAILREKWQTELSERFGVKADICSSKETLETIQRHRRGDLHEFAIIASIQGIRPPSQWDDEEKTKGAPAELARLFDELESEDPIFDLAIIDEAHYLRNPGTQTSKLGGLIRAVSDGMVLLSATPIQLKSEDLYHQVKHLDEITFDNEFSFQRILESSRPLIELRDRVLHGKANQQLLVTCLQQAQTYPGLRDSQQIRHLLDNVPDASVFEDRDRRGELADAIERINPLGHVLTRTRKRDVHERRVVREPNSIRVPMTDIEEEFYQEVTDKVREYCLRNGQSTGFQLIIPQRQMTSSMPAACRAWLKKTKRLEADEQQFQYEALSLDEETQVGLVDIGPLTQELIDIAEEIGDYETLREHDTKYQFLLSNLRSYWANYPDKKIILFAFYRETLSYLHERLTEDGISAMVLRGGMDKKEAFERFKNPQGPRLLLASEVASEGVDLQFSSLLINYDLPWNPQRIEQRIGRIDRIGQKEEKIFIWNLFYEDTLDDRVYSRLLERLEIFKAALGSLESVLGEDIRKMTQELFSHKLTPEQEVHVIEQTEQAIANRRVQEEQLEEQATHLVAHGDYIQNKVNAARELKRYVAGEDLYSYVRDFLDDEFSGCRFVRVSTEELLFTIELSGDAKAAFTEFLRRARLQGKTRLTQATNKMRFRFENRVVWDAQNQVEIISQFHPLIRFISDYYRAKGERKYFRVVGVEVSRMELPDIASGVYLFAIQRWSMKIALRDVERLAYQVISLGDGEFLGEDDAESLINTTVHNGSDWLAAGNEMDGALAEEMFGQCEDILEERYQSFVDTHMRENADRMAFHISNLEQHYRTKEEKWSVTIDRIRNQGDMNTNIAYLYAKFPDLFGETQIKQKSPSESKKDENTARSLEGKLEKLRQRTEEKISEIKKSADPKHDSVLVNSGVIRVY